MINSGDRLSDGLAQIVNTAMGMTQGLRREVETLVKSQLERLMSSMDMVSREEFEAVRDIALKAHEENSALAARISQLEAKSSTGN